MDAGMTPERLREVLMVVYSLCSGSWENPTALPIIRQKWDKEWDTKIIACPECGREVLWNSTLGVFGHARDGSFGLLRGPA